MYLLTRSILALIMASTSSIALCGVPIYLYLDTGVWFGGEQVAENPGGDDYRAGGGATASIGLSWKFSQKTNTYWRNNIGGRYQGASEGEGRNQGLLFESAIVQRLRQFNLGIGLHHDFNNSVKNEFGESISFDPSSGLYLTAEWAPLNSYGIGFKYSVNDYTGSDNHTYDGNQIGIFLSAKLY